MEPVFLNGKEFVKASEAAKAHGYTNDYIGQLCRGGKIDAKLVGRTWYVNIDSLLEHRKGRYRSNQKKTKEEVRKVLSEVERTRNESQPNYSNYLVPHKKIEYTAVNDEDLNPVPKKLHVESEEESVQETVSLEIEKTEENEGEYYLDTIYQEKPKSGVLTIVEDETEIPSVTIEESTFTVIPTKTVQPTTQKHTQLRKIQDLKQESFNVTQQPNPDSKNVATGESEAVPNKYVSIAAPLSVSLLAGLAVAMLMVGISWQFQSDTEGYSEGYSVNMSSLMYR